MQSVDSGANQSSKQSAKHVRQPACSFLWHGLTTLSQRRRCYRALSPIQTKAPTNDILGAKVRQPQRTGQSPQGKQQVNQPITQIMQHCNRALRRRLSIPRPRCDPVPNLKRYLGRHIITRPTAGQIPNQPTTNHPTDHPANQPAHQPARITDSYCKIAKRLRAAQTVHGSS